MLARFWWSLCNQLLVSNYEPAQGFPFAAGSAIIP
jgi:hypothetical protein